MTATLEAIKDKPVALYQMDDTSPFQDYSGYSRVGNTVSGTAGTAIALTAGTSFSTTFTNTVIGRFESPVFKQNSEDVAFTLEAWVYVSGTGTVQILGNTGKNDGLMVTGTKVSFVTKYLTAGECRAEYDLQIPRKFYAVGVHTSEKNMLFIDGVLVAETEITEAQKADKFVATDANLYSGAGTMRVALNNVALYAGSLSPDAISRHYTVGNSHVARDAIPSQYGGVRIPLSNNAADVFASQTWSSETDWNLGFLTDTTVENAQLRPSLEGGISVPGTWQSVFSLDSAGVTSIYGVNMLWDGEGAIVSASLDGTTWETAERGKNLTLIPSGFNPTDKDLYVRVSFAGGVVDDPSFIDNLTVTGFRTGVVPQQADRTVTTNGFVRNDYEPAELRDDWGVKLSTGKTLTVSADTSGTPMNPFVVEVWAKGPFNTNLGAGSTYSNGGTVYSPIADDWQVRTYVLTAANTAGFTITSTGETIIGQIVIYPDTRTAAQVKEVFDAYIGIPRVVVNDPATIGITETPEATAIYDYDWSISAAD